MQYTLDGEQLFFINEAIDNSFWIKQRDYLTRYITEIFHIE